MRLAGKQKLGYFPLPLAEAERIRRFLQFPLSGYAALDPCIGDGGAFKVIAGNPLAIRYGIELDAGRVEQAREVAPTSFMAMPWMCTAQWSPCRCSI